jgi:hypothetical protein
VERQSRYYIHHAAHCVIARALHIKIILIINSIKIGEKMQRKLLLSIFLNLFFASVIFSTDNSFTAKVYMVNPRYTGIAAYFSDCSMALSTTNNLWATEIRVHPTDGNKTVNGLWVTPITSTEPTGCQKSILATLLNAKNESTYVRVFYESTTGVITAVEAY